MTCRDVSPFKDLEPKCMAHNQIFTAVATVSAAVLSLLGGGVVWLARRQFGAGQSVDEAIVLSE